MKTFAYSLGVLQLVFGIGCLYGQLVPESELLNRLNANKSAFPQWEHGANLLEQERSTGEDVDYKPIVSESSSICDTCQKLDGTKHPEVVLAAERSDLVIVGQAIRNISALNSNQTFIITDSEIRVESVWKNGSLLTGTPIVAPGTEITIVTPGGMIKTGGHTIKASPSNREPIKSGHRYLLYLKYLPASNSYTPIAFEGFELGEQTIKPLKLTTIAPNGALLTRPADFLAAMKASTVVSSGAVQ